MQISPIFWHKVVSSVPASSHLLYDKPRRTPSAMSDTAIYTTPTAKRQRRASLPLASLQRVAQYSLRLAWGGRFDLRFILNVLHGISWNLNPIVVT